MRLFSEIPFGNTRRKTGLWREEHSHCFRDFGYARRGIRFPALKYALAFGVDIIETDMHKKTFPRMNHGNAL